MPDIVLNVFYIYHLILIQLQGKYYYTHFVDNLAAEKLAEGYRTIKAYGWNLYLVVSRPGFRFLNFPYGKYNNNKKRNKNKKYFQEIGT